MSAGPTIEVVRRLASEAETRLIGLALGRVLRGGEVVLLEGALGAGKTTLVRALAEGLGVEVSGVSSPTFVVVHQYEPRGGGRGPTLVHVDAYRVSGGEELETLGWDRVVEMVGSGSGCVVVEWAERLGPEVGGLVEAARGVARVRLEHAGTHEREFRLEAPASWRGRAGMADVEGRVATTCPITGRSVPAESATYPFADERARLADLQRWFSGRYSIGRGVEEEDLDDGPEGVAKK